VEMNFVSRIFFGLTQLFELLPSPLPNLNHLMGWANRAKNQSQDREWTPFRQMAGEFSGTEYQSGRWEGILIFAQWSFRHLVQARSSIFQKHLSEGHMPTAQFKKSHCGCTTKNGTLVKPGRCPNCGPSQTLRKSLHGAHALCGCTTSRGNPQRLDRCKPAIQQAQAFPLCTKRV